MTVEKGTCVRFSMPAIILGSGLLLSGILHLGWLLISGSAWEGPLSFRKPGLFGISSGLTLWSIAWAVTKLRPRPHDFLWTNLVAVSLVLEVGLITLQTWRGVPSHFNRSTTFDASVEMLMLLLIAVVMAWIAWLTIRSASLPSIDATSAMAIRGGLWLLLISGGLGFAITLIGHLNIADGKSPEIWGAAGVLKYPHGAVLHAIQLLPVLGWMMARLRVKDSAWFLSAALGSQVLYLCHAVWQTFQGRSRFDLDAIGGGFLIASGLLICLPFAVIFRATIATVNNRFSNRRRFA